MFVHTYIHRKVETKREQEKREITDGGRTWVNMCTCVCACTNTYTHTQESIVFVDCMNLEESDTYITNGSKK